MGTLWRNHAAVLGWIAFMTPWLVAAAVKAGLL